MIFACNKRKFTEFTKDPARYIGPEFDAIQTQIYRIPDSYSIYNSPTEFGVIVYPLEKQPEKMRFSFRCKNMILIFKFMTWGVGIKGIVNRIKDEDGIFFTRDMKSFKYYYSQTGSYLLLERISRLSEIILNGEKIDRDFGVYSHDKLIGLFWYTLNALVYNSPETFHTGVRGMD